MKSIVVVGSSNTDMIVQLERLPRPGETLLGGKFVTAAGGKGANQAVAAARAGGAVTFIASLGQDTLGDQALAGFVKAGINIDYVTRDRTAPSGVALIFVAQDGENSIAVAPGANENLSPAYVLSVAEIIRQASILVVQLETPLETVQAAANIAAQAGVKVVLNPAPARALPDELLRQVWVLSPNETEAELLTGQRVSDEPSASKAAAILLTRGVKNVIITLGSRGAFVANHSFWQWVPPVKVKAVDTTAAGDVFNGALAVALCEGKSLLAAAQFASAAAAISVTRLGAQTSAPYREEIEPFLKPNE